jgi:hypothetical protein
VADLRLQIEELKTPQRLMQATAPKSRAGGSAIQVSERNR